jgi:hypothetical protein
MRELVEIIAAFPAVAIPVVAICAALWRSERGRRFVSHPAFVALLPVVAAPALVALCLILLAISPSFREADAEVRNGRRAFDQCLRRERLEICRERAHVRREEFLRRTGQL